MAKNNSSSTDEGTANSTRNVPIEFEEAGIKPLAYGQPELAKSPSFRALARQIQRDGIKDEAGNSLAAPDQETADAIARQFVYPRSTASAAFKAPVFKHVQAGTVALVYGAVLLTRVNPSLLNPRVGPLTAIPEVNSEGRVPVGWAPADIDGDPNFHERLSQKVGSLDELVTASRQTADNVLGLQAKLAESIAREGIEEELLIVQTRLDVAGTAQPTRTIVPIAADGGSRITIAQENLADAIAAMLTEKEAEYARRHKRRGALEELERALRAHQPASLIDDPVAERELRDYLVELSTRPAAELMKTGLYAAQRSLVAPAMVVVGFRANGSATIIDAIDQLVANQHKRGPLQWQPAAQALDSRNSVVRALWRQAAIGEGTALLLGPRYQEATEKFDISDNPDLRIGEAVRVFHSQDARKPIREAYGAPTAALKSRAEIITSVIGEQLRNGDPAFRRQVDTTLREVLTHPPLWGSDQPAIPMNNPDPDELVEKVKAAEKADPGVFSEHHVELGVKGGVALVMLGALSREYGSLTDDVPRPYTALQRLVRTESGQELLGDAIKALRAGDNRLPALDPETREEKGRDAENRVIPMDTKNLHELVFGPEGDAEDGPQRTTDEVIAEIKDVARNRLGRLVNELITHPDVVRSGIAPEKVADATEILLDQAGELDYIGRKGADHLRASEDAQKPVAVGEED